MSVRKRKWKDKEGNVHEAWVVHIKRVDPTSGVLVDVRKQLAGVSKRDAETWERSVLAEITTGTYGRKEAAKEKKDVPTVAAFAGEFVTTYAKVHNKPSEVWTKESHLKVHLVPVFGGMRLDEIGLRDIERYKAKKVAEGQAPKSINNHLTVLRRLLGVAAEWGLIEAAPKFKLMKAPKPKFDFLTFEESDRLIEAAEEPWKTEVIVALRTGLRHGELHGLRWGDVDLVSGRLVVRQSLWRKQFVTPKNGKEREIPLSDDAIRALKRHRHLKGELVFSADDGNLLLATACKWPLWRACKKAGLRPIQWHVLRHTFASHLVMRGAPIKAVQELMGHSTIEMTMRYAHLSPDARRDAVMLLDRRTAGAHREHTGVAGSENAVN
jgi:integrase